MPNLARIYSDAIGEDKEPENQEEGTPKHIKDASHLNWLTNPETQEMFSKLRKESEVLIDNSVALAIGNSDPKQIVTNLIRVNEIRRIIKENGK